MKCPKCNHEMIVEDDQCDTDRGILGSKYWICEKCGEEKEDAD